MLILSNRFWETLHDEFIKL